MLRLLATNALTAVSKAQHDSVAKMFAADLKQHDPRLANGLAGVLSLCDTAGREPYTRVLHRTLVDGQHVLLHSSNQPLHRSGSAAKVAFDLFRFDGLQIVEHWRAEEPLSGLNASRRSQVDGEVAISDLHLTLQNLEQVRLFKELVTVELRYDLIERFIDDANYAQHASKVGDGIARLRKRIAEVAEQASDESTPVMKPRKYLAEGNFVFLPGRGSVRDAAQRQLGFVSSREPQTSGALGHYFRHPSARSVEERHWTVLVRPGAPVRY